MIWMLIFLFGCFAGLTISHYTNKQSNRPTKNILASGGKEIVGKFDMNTGKTYYKEGYIPSQGEFLILEDEK